MPNIKFLQGKLASLPSKITEGQVYFAYEDVKDGNNVVGYKGSIYIDKDSSTRVKMTANADVAATANKALNDYDGKDIRRYLVSAEQTIGSDKSRTFTFKTGSDSETKLAIPVAGNVDSGLITNLDQTLYGFKRMALRAKPCAIVGSDTANTNGWYKVADSTMKGYGNTDIIYLVQEGYGRNSGGILHVQMRSDNTSIQTYGIKWLVRQEGLFSDMIRITISGMKWTMYAYRGISQYGRLSFTELSHNSIGGDAPSYTVNYYNSTTKESTEPTASVTSSDGGLVAAANKAYVDSSNQNIVNTYIKALAFTDYGTKLEPTLGSGTKGAKIALPVAGTGSAGIVTTGDQTFAGKKTFKGIEVNNSAGFNYSAIEAATNNSSRVIWFARNDSNGIPCYNTNFTYNPATKTLNAENINGTAAKATADAGNRNIANTYAKYNGFSFVAGTDNITMKATAGSGTVNNSAGVIPAANTSAAGVVTTGAQTFNGNKTFNNSIVVNDCLISKAITNTNITKLILLSTPQENIGDTSHTTSVYFKALLKWICSNYPNKIECTFLGRVTPNSVANTFIFIYNTSQIDATSGLPQYSSGSYTHLGGNIYTFGTYNYAFYFRESLMSDSKYAGSASSGGAATSANKLNTNAGSATLPVYFSNGIPVSCSTNLGVSITGNAASATKLTSSAGSATQPIYFKDGKPVVTTYSLNATIKAGVSNRIAFYSGNNEISSTNYLKYYTATNSKKANQTILRIWGTTYGNDATTTISGKASSLNWNDGGPQIQFSTSEAGSQDGALIFTDHDSAGVGASFHFVSNQSEWSVVSKNFVAKTRIIIGQEAHTSNNQGYNLYVNGTEYINGILTAVGDCKFIAHDNEFNFVPTLKASTSVWLNYRQTGGQPTDGNFIINEYIFGNGANKALASIKDGLFSGAATYVRDSNNKTNNISITYSKAGQASTSWLASWNGYELGCISPANITAGKATKLATARTITLSGAVTGSGSFDGSGNLTITTTTNHTHSYLPLNGGTLTGKLIIQGNAESQPLMVRNIVGSEGNSTVGPLYLQYGAGHPINLGKTGAYNISADGSTYSGTSAKANQLTTARTISLGGLSSGSVSFNGTSNVTINNWGYGNYKYVTTDSTDAPYYRVATTSTTASYTDRSMVFVIDSGYEDGGFGIVKVVLRTDTITAANNTHGRVTWLARQGFSANQLILKVTTQANGTQYADLYFKATGTYNACNIVVLEMGGRGISGQAWIMTNPSSEAARASMNIRTYTNEYVGYDAGNVNYSSLAYQATKLQTARNINGTSFDGTADIVTAKWGNGRTFQVKDSATTYAGDSVTVDGSAGVVLKMPAHGKFVSGLDIGNGTSTGSTINFYPASTSSIGCKIVAYSDRIEFVF